MKRRTFIKGAVSVAVAASLPAPEYTYKTYKTARSMDVIHPIPVEMGERMARALAHSMMQTKELVGANILHRGFPETDALRSPLLDDLFPDDSEVHRS